MGKKSIARAGVVKRLISATVIGGLFVVVYHHGGASVRRKLQQPLMVSYYPKGGIQPLNKPTSLHRPAHPIVSPQIFPSHPGGPSTSPSYPTFTPPPGQRDIDFSSESLPVEATLRERLDIWRNAPGARGEIPGEVELGGFVQWNIEVRLSPVL